MSLAEPWLLFDPEARNIAESEDEVRKREISDELEFVGKSRLKSTVRVHNETCDDHGK